jgi:hypothetical protein
MIDCEAVKSKRVGTDNYLRYLTTLDLGDEKHEELRNTHLDKVPPVFIFLAWNGGTYGCAYL